MHIRNRLIGIAAFALATLSPVVNAAPTQWTTGPDANGHYYEVIQQTGLTWAQADAMASAMFFEPEPGVSLQGHLVTIKSAEENAFVYNLMSSVLGPQYWIGGFQVSGSTEPGNGWQWVNSEGPIPTPQVPVMGEYSNWLGGEPNNASGGVENQLTIGIDSTPFWNDSIPFGGNGGFIVEYDGTLPAGDCNPCNPSGVLDFDLPDDIVLPPGATVTQNLLQTDPAGNPAETVKFPDPRVDGNGVCTDRRYLDVFREVGNFDPSMYGKLILPPWLCGSPEFAVLQSDLNFVVQEDVVRSRQLPEEIFGLDTFPCEIDAVLGDLQTRGVFVWQPDDRREVIPRHALELTNACGSRRGATKGGSFFVLNLHIDWGIAFGTNNALVTQRFEQLTVGKFAAALSTLLQGRAQRLITRSQYRSLRRQLAKARNQFLFGNFGNSKAELATFISDVENAGIAPSDENLEGNLVSRAENITFTIEKIESVTPPPIP